MYDDLYVHVVTADEAAASNGIVAKGRIRIHKVVLEHADGAAVLSAQLHNQLTVTGTAEISLTTNLADGTTFQRYTEANFNPPVPFSVGLSTNITGTGSCRIYYSR
jgi:hypothetical protein